jgi:hypothetical protein
MTAHRATGARVDADRLVLERLTPLDVTNLRIERHGLPMNVAALAILEGGALLDASGELALEAIKARIEQRLHLAPRLRQRLYRPGVARALDARWCLDFLDTLETFVGEHGHFDPDTRRDHFGDFVAVLEQARPFYRRALESAQR